MENTKWKSLGFVLVHCNMSELDTVLHPTYIILANHWRLEQPVKKYEDKQNSSYDWNMSDSVICFSFGEAKREVKRSNSFVTSLWAILDLDLMGVEGFCWM